MTKLKNCKSEKIKNKIKILRTEFKMNDNFSQMMMENKINGFTKSEIESLDDTSSVSSITSEEQQHHTLAPKCMAGRNRPCLVWACKACKKKSVAVDRRRAATMRERRRLKKVTKEVINIPTVLVNC